MNPYYELFERQWKRGRATEEDLTLAVEKSYITEEEKVEIMALEQTA